MAFQEVEMGSTEFLSFTDGRRLLFRSFSEPWFGRALLAGPRVIMDLAEHGEPCDHDLYADSVIVLDPEGRRAVACASAVFTADEDGRLSRAERSIAAGLWRAFGWELGFVDEPDAVVPGRWPASAPVPPVTAADALALWSHLGSWSPLRPSVPSQADLAPLHQHDADFAVVFRAGLPVLAQGDGRPAPRPLAFAVGCAVAAGRLDPVTFALTSPEGWLAASLPEALERAEPEPEPVPRLRLDGATIEGVPAGIALPWMGCDVNFFMFPGVRYNARMSGSWADAARQAHEEAGLLAVFRELEDDVYADLGVLVRVLDVTRHEDDADGDAQWLVLLVSLARIRRAGDTFRVAEATAGGLPPLQEVRALGVRALEAMHRSSSLLAKDLEPPDLDAVERIDDLGRLVDVVSNDLLVEPEVRRAVFEAADVGERVTLALETWQAQAETFERAYATLSGLFGSE